MAEERIKNWQLFCKCLLEIFEKRCQPEYSMRQGTFLFLKQFSVKTKNYLKKTIPLRMSKGYFETFQMASTSPAHHPILPGQDSSCAPTKSGSPTSRQDTMVC